MSDNDMNEVEDVSFLPGPHIGKKSVYEPSTIQKCKQLICSPTKAALIISGVIIVVFCIALIAALARPAPGNTCSATPAPGSQVPQPTEATAANGEPFPWKDIRLPTHIEPVSYRLFMHPDLRSFQFTGSVAITFKCNEAEDFLVFHSKNLVISSYDLFAGENSGTKVAITKTLEYVEYEQIWLQLDRALEKGKTYLLKLNFTGELTDSLSGFYRSSYNTSAGEQRWLATTHFEPTDARAAFPCFDEPSLKATFSLSMVRDTNHISLFNTPNISMERYPGNPDLIMDHFNETVPMSTYLVAMVVCDYAGRHAKTTGGVDVSVYAPPEQISQADFALDVATEVVSFYGTYFNIDYPLAKSDHIAIPDFQAGAMENWGLITYLMRALLVNTETSSPRDQQWAAVVISHELAHQWFGNLVTMKWWNDLWLNEGFARFVEFIGTDHAKPEWNMFDQMLTDVTTVAMYYDGLRSSHPISVEVHNPSEIDEIFDAISYEKGAAVIRMCENFLTQIVFRDGLQDYLQTHQYGNAETDDLWAALSAKAKSRGKNVNVKEVMDTWTRQMGYPMVTAKRDGDHMTFTQERFLFNPRSNTTKEEFTSPYGYQWRIPLSYITETSPEATELWLHGDSVSTPISGSPTWIKLNPGMAGFYRVHYDDNNWKALIDVLHNDHTALSAADRASLMEDAFALTRSGHMRISDAMDLSLYLKNEQEFVPWDVARSCLGYISGLLEGTDTHSLFSAYMKTLMAPLLESLTWDKMEGHLQQFLQAALLTEAVHLHEDTAVETAKSLFSNWMQSPDIELNPNLKAIIYSAGIKYGGEAEWKFMWNKFLKTNEATEKKKYLTSLASTTDVTLINRFLNFALDDTKIRSADAVSVFQNLARNPAGRIQTWRFLKRNWHTLYDKYKDLGFQLRHIIVDPTFRFSSQFDYDEVKTFFENNLEGRTVRATAQTLESIDMNIDWLNRNEAELIGWLKKQTTSR